MTHRNIILISFLATSGMMLVFLAANFPTWAVTTLAVFAAIEAVALVLQTLDERHDRR